MSVRLWLHPAILYEYARNARIRARRARRGHTRMPGDAAAIVRAGIERCWNGRTFTASPGHFNVFWTRDLCFSATSLVALGEGARVATSLRWAIGVWERRGSHVTTTIHPGSWPADVYDYGLDSLPLLLAALRALGPAGDEIVLEHHAWLAAEVDHFAATVVEPSSGLVRADRTYSAHRDTVTNRSNAYGNTMVALLARTIAERPAWALPTTLLRHFPEDDFGVLLRSSFWDGDHYRDAIGEDRSSGEANRWPFWTGVETDPGMLAAAFGYLRREGYTDPLPLRYEVERRPELEVWLTRHLLPDYQGSTVWTSLGAMYLSLLREVEPTRALTEIARYRAMVERDGTFWEVLDPATTECWVSPRWVMIGEESMLWGAILGAVIEAPDAAALTLSPRRLIATGDEVTAAA
jgi:hypothetical protein